MYITIQVNNKKIRAERGETILSALNRNGIIIPTLCRMKDFSPTGACRMCVVEVEGKERLVTACSQPVEEWMKILTHSPRVIAARKTIVELLLSNHPDDCLYCDRNLDCELQSLAAEMNIRERRIRGRKIKPRLDQSSHAIVRELSKCILCGRCVRVCEEVITATSIDFINRGGFTHIGPALDRDFNFSSCINCGQCVVVCPTGALHEKHYLNEVIEHLNKPDITRVIQYSPLVASGVAADAGIRYTRDFDKILNSVLRKIGFDKVFSTGTGSDILISELADDLNNRLSKGSDSPLYISACPAWVKYAEQFMPDTLSQLSTLKPPQQITGALIKTIGAANLEPGRNKIYSVSVTPCVAMKFEARRDGMTRKGISDVDSVLTVRELSGLIAVYGIDLANINPEPADEPMGERSSAASLSELSGGYAEAVVRTLILKNTGNDPGKNLFKKLRSSGDFREGAFDTGKQVINVAVIDGLTGLTKLMSAFSEGRKFDIIEVMACPGGCVSGAGISSKGQDDRKTRIRMIYQEDETDPVNLPVKSPLLNDLYNKYIHNDKNLSDKEFLHTHFEKRDVLL